MTHLCSPSSNEEGEKITSGEDERTRVLALTSVVEGKRTARRRQLPGSECVVSQDTTLHLCHLRLSCPCVICALSCAVQLLLTQQEEGEPGRDRVPGSQMGNVDHILPSILEDECWFKHLPHQLVGAAVTLFALLRWAQILGGPCYILLLGE